MVTRQEGERATRFIGDLLNNSGLYIVAETTFQGVQAGSYQSSGERYSVLIANSFPSVKAFQDQLQAQREKAIYTCPILYKDGETAFRRLVDAEPRFRNRRYSLREYRPAEIQRMLQLRDIEIALMRNETLWYYQPESAKLPESLRQFRMHLVNHIFSDGARQESNGRAQDGPSARRKLPEELERTTTAIQLVPGADYGAGITQARNRLIPRTVALDNLATARNAFRGLPLEMALDALHGNPL